MKNIGIEAVPITSDVKVDYVANLHGYAIYFHGKLEKLVGTFVIKGFKNVTDVFELNELGLPNVFNVSVTGVSETCVCFCNRNNNPYIMEGVIVLASDIESVSDIVKIYINDGAI